MNKPAPYDETLGGDPYSNGRERARPIGVPRNSLEAAGYSSLDLRARRDLKVGGTTQAAHHHVSARRLHVLKEVNYGSFVGIVDSPFVGQPVSALAPRQLQLSARMKF